MFVSLDAFKLFEHSIKIMDIHEIILNTLPKFYLYDIFLVIKKTS